MALISFPKVMFSQTAGNETTTHFAILSPNEKICNSHISPSADSTRASSCTLTEFDNILPEKNLAAPAILIETDHCFPAGQCYSAFIDNQNFPLQGFRTVTATVAESSPGDGSGAARSVVSITIAGNAGATNKQDLSNEVISLELVLLEPIEPEPAACNVTLHHLSKAYSILKGDGNSVEITDFIWSMDRKSFTLSLNFNCTMRSLGFPADGMKDVNLKGKLVRVHVAEPSSVSASE